MPLNHSLFLERSDFLRFCMDKRGLQRSTVLKLMKTYGVEVRNFLYEVDYVIANTYILTRPYFCVVSLSYNLPYCDTPHMFNGVTEINPLNLININATENNITNIKNFLSTSIVLPKAE